MARFKPYSYDQLKLVPVSFERQILPGTFEATLSRLIDEEIDLSVFEARYRNDEVGAPAYDPAILLKVILYAYARGVTSSREIARLCRENVLFMALAADSAPHFTTIADFIATLDREIVAVFRDVLLVCDELGLIGREMFAVDGVKLPRNATTGWRSWTASIKSWCTRRPSAKPKSTRCWCRCWRGRERRFASWASPRDVLAGAVVAADAGFHTDANIQYLEGTHVDGYLADTLFRKRDPRFVTAERHKPEPVDDPARLFRPEDFRFDPKSLTCICPAGKRLYRSGQHNRPDGYRAVIFK